MVKSLVLKDLLIEFKSKEIITSMVSFGVSVILLFSFSFRASPAQINFFAPGLLWMIFIFISIILLNRIYNLEMENKSYEILFSSPIDKSNIYLSKCISSLIFLIFSQIIVTPIFFLFLQINYPENLFYFLMIIFFVDLGICSLGSIISGSIMKIRANEILLPILFFPMITPLIISAVKSTDLIFNNHPFIDWKIWFQLILSFSIVFFSSGFLLYPYVTNE
tara:strand:+ start:109146 stop:109808 length:663 start_codon:yes stop_codon:yes gene_type:complete